MELELPWPPSVNSYLAIVGRRKVKTKKARDYCKAVEFALIDQRVCSFGDQRLSVEIEAFPPDRRKRDVDNLFKSLLDSLKLAGVYEDDSQIDFLSIKRMQVYKGGKVCLRISEL